MTLFSFGCFAVLALLWKSDPKTTTSLPYDLNQPSGSYQLPEVLNELSGISYLGAQTVACIQDEKGIVYFYDLESQKIIRKLKFEKKGDYEDLCIVNDDLYILKSNGDLFRIKNYESADFKVKKYETRLSTKNDTEGLCYDIGNDRLLILCKEKAGVKEKIKNKKAIYSFPLDDKKVNKLPLHTIDTKDVADYFDKKHSKTHYKPAAIAIHPLSGELYIIDSVENSLSLLSQDGELLAVHKLPETLLPQPEGISFDENGNLYISSEASETTMAVIHFFKQL